VLLNVISPLSKFSLGEKGFITVGSKFSDDLRWHRLWWQSEWSTFEEVSLK
jgi:hypothetical protein